MRYFTQLIFIFLLYPTVILGQQLEEDSNLISGKLDNGLQYFLYKTDRVKGQAEFQMFLKAGSLQESNKQRGLAHFMEHMAFNGSKHFPGNTLIDFLERNGAKFGHDLNAHTSYGETIYKLKIPTKQKSVVDSTLVIIKDWIEGISLDSLEIEKERGVVLSEWLSKQNASQKTNEAFLELLLNDSRYSHRKVIGDTTTLRNFNRKDILDFYNSWYDPSLMAIAVAGDFDTDDVLKQIKTNFKDIPSKNITDTSYPINDFEEFEYTVITDEGTKKIELTGVQLLEPFRDIKTENEFYFFLQKNLLNDLFQERLDNKSFLNPAYEGASISLGNYFPVKAALMYTVKLQKDSVAKGLEQYWYDVEQIFQYGFTSMEISKIKKQLLQQLRNNAENKEQPSSGKMIKEMYQKFFYGNAIVTPEKEFELTQKSLKSVDSLSLLNYLKQIRKPEQTKYILTANKADEQILPKVSEFFKYLNFEDSEIQTYERNLDVPENLLSTIPDPGKITSKKYIPEVDATEYLLSNGVKLIYKQTDLDKNAIIISGFRKGGYYALKERDYITGLYAAPVISLSGYGDFTRDALSQFLAGNSAKATLLADKTRTGFYASADKRDQKTVFQLLYLKWTAPRMDEKIFEEIKSRTIEAKQNEISKPGDLFGEKIKKALKGEDYVTRKLKAEEIESELDASKIIDTYHQFFGNAKDYNISLISDQPFEDLKSDVLQYIGTLPKGKAATKYRYQPSHVLKDDVVVEQKDGDSPKATVSLIYQQNTILKSLPETDLLNQVVKNLIRNRLLKKLREEMGAVYSVSVSASSTKQPLTLSRQSISFVCEPKDVDKLIDETEKILSAMAAGNFSEEELLKIKTNLKKMDDLLKQRNTYWTKAIREHYFNHFPNWEAVTHYKEWIDSLSKNEIAEAIQVYFKKSPTIKAILWPENESNNNQ
ncbi:M16 family metallopeptidase [Zunongwangia sp. HGR-M22]|uniref:M16 family metallopeptidase n=1 Tax=Zunongwangia sp. HGR-M22 TaxID=3015168 RepID=UPI0022DD450E|nr:M16 family metallopeptidase [Zunongwangia sp. HGR-M22]WBL26721.1 insulinase family protein [Zunongwangia sp. HGR-M22]